MAENPESPENLESLENPEEIKLSALNYLS